MYLDRTRGAISFGPVLVALISVANQEPRASATWPLAAWIAVQDLSRRLRRDV